MQKEDNILLAKKYLVDSIYRSVNIEGIAMTFPETQMICEGMSVAGHSIDDINAVNDLKHAWEWIFQNIDKKIDIDTLKKLNLYLGKYTVINAGILRSMFDEIRISGTTWIPELPPKSEIIDRNIQKITANADKTEAALNLFCYCARGQFFNDGNKRTATLISNMVLIQNGCGILSIPTEQKQEFYTTLLHFYETGESAKLKNFLSTNCITVMKELSVGNKLQLLREKKQMTRDYVAEQLKVPLKKIYDIESGIKTDDNMIGQMLALYHVTREQAGILKQHK